MDHSKPVIAADYITMIRKILDSAIQERGALRAKIALTQPKTERERKAADMFAGYEITLGEQLESLGQMVQRLEDYLDAANGVEEQHRKGERQ